MTNYDNAGKKLLKLDEKKRIGELNSNGNKEAASRCRREKQSAFDFRFTAMSIITQEEAMFVPPVMS